MRKVLQVLHQTILHLQCVFNVRGPSDTVKLSWRTFQLVCAAAWLAVVT